MEQAQQEAAAVRLAAYTKALIDHDWQWDYADRAADRAKGRASLARLMLERAEIDADGAIWNRHAPVAHRMAPPAPIGVFKVDGQECQAAELLRANADDEDLCAWARRAAVGERFPALVDCVRLA